MSPDKVIKYADNNRVVIYDGRINKVDKSTIDAVTYPILKFKKKSQKASDFVSNLEINIASDFSNVKLNNSFGGACRSLTNSTKGFSVWEPGLPRVLAFQETSFATNKIKNLFSLNNFQAKKEISNTTMHELGHQFDSYFGYNPDSSTHKQYKAMMQKHKDNMFSLEVNDQDYKIYEDFQKTNGLSDSKEFKNAFLKDVQAIVENKKISNFEAATNNYIYFIADVDLSKVPTAKDIEEADFSRSETFAQLFSYANGEDDGDKKTFTDLFSNTYKVVQKDIKRNL